MLYKGFKVFLKENISQFSVRFVVIQANSSNSYAGQAFELNRIASVTALNSQRAEATSFTNTRTYFQLSFYLHFNLHLYGTQRTHLTSNSSTQRQPDRGRARAREIGRAVSFTRELSRVHLENFCRRVFRSNL